MREREKFKNEAEFQAAVIELARLNGLAVFHPYDSRRSEPGFPDLVIVGARGVIYRELKTERGRLSPEQEYWLAALTEAGENARTWRPYDWETGSIQRTLSKMGRLRTSKPKPPPAELRKHLTSQRGVTKAETVNP